MLVACVPLLGATSIFVTGADAGQLPAVGASSATSTQDANSVSVTNTQDTDVVLTTSWDPTQATFDSGSAIAPEGWTIEYSTDGSTWSTSQPVDSSTVTSVRASGKVRSQGDGGSGNTLRQSRLSADVTGSPLPFAASSGGDGYDVAFPDADRVINVYHHNGPGGVYPVAFDCKLRSTGGACPEGKIVFDDDPLNPGPGPYIAPNNSRVTVHQPSRKAFTAVVRRSDWALGFLCVDYSLATPAPCTTEFIRVSTQSVIDNRPGWAGASLDMGGTAFDGDRFFVVNGINHRLYCLDMATASVCQGFGERTVGASTVDGFQLPPNSAEGPAGPGSGAWGYSSDISVIDGRVYFFQGDRYSTRTFGCVDPTTVAYCQGTSSPADVGGDPFEFPPFPLYGTDGSLQAVCLFLHRSCIDPMTSVLRSMPSNLAAFLDPATSGGISYFSAYAIYFSLVEWGVRSSRLFFPVEAGGLNAGGYWPSDLACWDFSTGTPCDFGANGFEPGIIRDVTPGLNLYSFVADPFVDCIWSNSDSGYIIAKGTDGGRCGGDDSASVFAFDEDDARLDCDASSDPIRWTELKLTLPADLVLSKLRLTVRDGNGAAVTGWNGIAVTSTTIDLSSLDVAVTGPAPQFDITFDNTGLDVASEVTADLRYITPPPQLCVNLLPITACTLGQAVDGRLPAPPFDVTHTSSLTVGVNVTTNTAIVPLSGAMYDARTQCGLGAIEGSTTLADGGSPVPGVIVTLRHPITREVLATATSDSSGYYKFDFLTPGTYEIEFSNVDGKRVTPESAIASPLVIVDDTVRADGLYQETGDGPDWSYGLLENLWLPDTA